MKDLIHTIKNRNVLLLWSGTQISQLGDSINYIAITGIGLVLGSFLSSIMAKQHNEESDWILDLFILKNN